MRLALLSLHTAALATLAALLWPSTRRMTIFLQMTSTKGGRRPPGNSRARRRPRPGGYDGESGSGRIGSGRVSGGDDSSADEAELLI